MIYGSSDKKKFLELQKLNKTSKRDTVSMLLLGEKKFDIYKIHHLSKKKLFPHKKFFNFYYGVNEIEESDEFEPKIVAPFFYENWIVGFDGFIYNKKSIIEEYSEYDFIVEKNNSSLITAIIHGFDIIEKSNEVHTIKECFSLVEGIYSCWIYNLKTRNGFLIKCNNDLYADIYDNSFSNEKVGGFELLKDGEIYQLTKEGITTVGYFDCSIL